MKKEIVKWVLVSCMTSQIISCSDPKKEGNTATAVDKEQIKKEIQAKEDEFAATYNAREIKEIGYYADDATSFFQNMPALIGKEAIVEFLKSDLMAANSNKISFKTDEVFVSNDGNQVVEVGYFKVVDSTNTTVNKGNYMSLFEKRNGKYVCVRDMSASDVRLSDQ
ncbi:MAG TPA: nuclear transport factor 2 family protein [Chitinophagaceae bacterium]|jgi:ketosteroid isomerase-like protein|nr:nuclear transport factor 2 family protein [Chitinophagaceae bacterium]